MKILVVSHDAGGAQLLSAWVKKHSENEYVYLLEGPAQGIFSEKLTLSRSISRAEMDDLFSNVSIDCVITSTSWNSDLERVAIHSAKHQGIKVISVLDHWSEYSARFKLGHESVFPDEIWVSDNFALELASVEFPRIPIHLISNYYFEEIKESFVNINKSLRIENSVKRFKKVLFITEPISTFSETLYGDVNHFGTDEYSLLARFLLYLLEDKDNLYVVRLRPHPSENANKYNDIFVQFEEKLNMTLSSRSSIIEDCAWADWVVGFDSMALVIGLLGGKKVSSCLPKNSKFKTLPFKEIEAVF